MTAFFQNLGMTYDWAWFTATIVGILVIALPLMLAVAMVIYAERKIWAAIALRRGPNVVGPWGLFQSSADLLKFVFKEPVIPAGPNKGVFLHAPLGSVTSLARSSSARMARFIAASSTTTASSM